MDAHWVLPAKIDHFFPYVCFTYGLVMTIALNWPALDELAETKFTPDAVARWRSHRGLAVVCLSVGGLWILQNLWLA